MKGGMILFKPSCEERNCFDLLCYRGYSSDISLLVSRPCESFESRIISMKMVANVSKCAGFTVIVCYVSHSSMQRLNKRFLRLHIKQRSHCIYNFNLHALVWERSLSQLTLFLPPEKFINKF